MKSFMHFIPTKLFVGELSQYSNEFTSFGNRALIVTSNSSLKNDSLNDLTSVLKEKNIEYIVFSEVEENPSLETVEKAFELAKGKVDFVVGLGGGSPMDASKAISILLNNPTINSRDLFEVNSLKPLPIIAIPTTSGTGSEVTQFSVITDNVRKTKITLPTPLFPDIAFLNAKYTQSMPELTTLSTAVDALSHLIEGYLSTGATFISDILAEGGLIKFGECVESLKRREFSYDVRESLLLISCIGGMVISQAKTSIPHTLGYSLTYFKNIPHGYSNGIVLCEYLKFHEDIQKVNKALNLMGFQNIDELKTFLDDVTILEVKLTDEELKSFTKIAFENKAKLKNHPYEVKEEDILKIYKESISN